MDDNKYTFPEGPQGFSFSEAEKKRWDRNLKKLRQRVEGKFGSKPKRKRKTQNDDDS
jgi:hypothetical protein